MTPRIDAVSVREASKILVRLSLTPRLISTSRHLAFSAIVPAASGASINAKHSISTAARSLPSSSSWPVQQLLATKPSLLRAKPAWVTPLFLPSSHKTSPSSGSPASHRLASTSSSSSSSSSRSSSSSSASQHEDSSHSESDASNESPNPSFRQRMRYLWKRYGWWSFGVYNLWSLADFSLTWAVIHMYGADHIREVETKVREAIGLTQREAADEEVAAWPLPGQAPAIIQGAVGGAGADKGANNETAAKDAADVLTKGVDEAKAAVGKSIASGSSQSRRSGNSTLWTEAVLAYTIHKTLLLPFRVMGTGALTPSFVKLMVRLGWAKPLPPAGTLSTAAKVTSSAASLGSTGAQQAAKGAAAAGKK